MKGGSMDTSRRDFIRMGALAGGALSLGMGGRPERYESHARPDAATAPERAPHPLRLLFLGGTTFLGPHAIKYALERGHQVATFTRGRTQAGIYRTMFREVEQLVGDRGGDHSALEGRAWDAVIDTSGFQLEWARTSTRLLRDAADVYVYTSSTGVYLPYLGTDLREDRELVLEDPPSVPEDRRPTYGVMKSLSEIAVREAFGEDRAVIVRPTYIVGPADPNTHRFPYWPVRLARGGEVMVPGKATDRVQFIDVRDLTEWMIRLAETRTGGTFNVAGPASPMHVHEFAHGVRAATSSEVSWVHVDDYDFLREHGVGSMLPWLMPVGDYEGSARINIDRSKAHGLTFRPLAQTAMDVLEWWESDAVSDERRDELLNGERAMMRREPEILAAWKARAG
jgi:2'-hydroxyisoflavone reductase